MAGRERLINTCEAGSGQDGIAARLHMASDMALGL